VLKILSRSVSYAACQQLALLVLLATFLSGAVTMLGNHPLVERYAWYPWNTCNALYRDDGSGTPAMTALGVVFAAAPQYR